MSPAVVVGVWLVLPAGLFLLVEGWCCGVGVLFVNCIVDASIL